MIKFKRLPDIPFCFNLKRRPSCQTLLNAFYMSREFDKVWHECLLFKLKQNGLSGGRISRNSSSAEIFEQSKLDFEEALKKWGYKAKLQYIQPNLQQNNTRKRTRKIIWFNPPFRLNVKKTWQKCFCN